jgi:hypothetical protein
LTVQKGWFLRIFAMNDFPLSREKWYSLRDDRTKRVDGASGFEGHSLGVVIDSKEASTYSIQVMAVNALNILARWCRKIRIEIPEKTVSCLPHHKGRNFVDIVIRMMKGADPFGDFTFGPISDGDVNQVLLIGQNATTHIISGVRIDGGGWIGGIQHHQDLKSAPSYDENPVGPVFASCLGVAELFREAVDMPSASLPCWYSLYDFQKAETPDQLMNPRHDPQLELGRIHQVGCGAVGSSLDFLLSLTDWQTELFLIDFDKVEFTDCNRSLCLNPFDVVKGRYKVDACSETLKCSRMQPVPFVGSYNEFINKRSFLDNPPDMILCLANEQNIWSCIQHNYPPLVLHATTTSNWGLNFGRHIPLKEWCIMCRFGNEIEHEFIPECSTGHLETDNKIQSTLGVLPFLSTAAATLILSELAKIGDTEYPINKNFIEFSMKASDGLFQQVQRKRRQDCICTEQTLDLYPNGIRETKYWELSTRKQNGFG